MCLKSHPVGDYGNMSCAFLKRIKGQSFQGNRPFKGEGEGPCVTMSPSGVTTLGKEEIGSERYAQQ